MTRRMLLRLTRDWAHRELVQFLVFILFYFMLTVSWSSFSAMASLTTIAETATQLRRRQTRAKVRPQLGNNVSERDNSPRHRHAAYSIVTYPC